MSTSKRVRSLDVGDDEPTKCVKPTTSTNGSMGWTGLGPAHTAEQLIHIQRSWSPLLDAVEDGSASLEECGRISQRVLSDTGPGSVFLQEVLGGSFMHISALKVRPKALEVMMSNFPHNVAPDANGRTPLQALHDELERQRVLLGPRFDGFSQDYMRCFSILSGVHIIDLSQVPTSVIEEVLSTNTGDAGSLFDHRAVVETLRVKYGYTCGLCIGGFFSTRMSLAFKLACANIPKHLNSDDRCTERHLWKENFSITRAWNGGYGWEEDFQYSYLFDCLADCVRNGRALTWKNVDHYCHSLDPGFKVNSRRHDWVKAIVVSAFEAAMEWDDRTGDGHYRPAYVALIDALQACRNDHEFGFVSRMCGYESLSIFHEHDTRDEMEM